MGSANVAIAPGGTSSTAAGPSGSSASIDDLTAGDLSMTRFAPTLDDLTIGSLSIAGNSPSSDGIKGANWDTDGIAINGCGYNVIGDTVTTDYSLVPVPTLHHLTTSFYLMLMQPTQEQ